jgi:hypothetical protein
MNHVSVRIVIAVLAVAALAGCTAQTTPPPHTNTPAPTTPAATQAAHVVDPKAAAAAETILKDGDTFVKTAYENGVSVAGTADQVTWWQTTGSGYFLTNTDTTFKKADTLFTATTEPTDAISAWRDTTTTLTTDITNWYLADDTNRPALQAKVEADLAQMDADAVTVGKG